MKELKEAQMGIIAVLALMLVSIKRRLPTRRFSSGITTLALAGIVLLVAAGSVSAADCSNAMDGPGSCNCGDTVVGDYTFNADLTSCPDGSWGLEVGASDITIDGAGYKMTGSRSSAACNLDFAFGGSPSETAPAKHSGIVNKGNYDNVVIKDLEIEGFCTGIALGFMGSTDIDNNDVLGCNIHNCGDDGRVTHGIHMVYTNNCTVRANTISEIDGSSGGGCSGGGNGIFMYGNSDGATRGYYNEFTCNNFFDNDKSGFFMKHQCMYNTISNNYAEGNGEGGIVPLCMKSNYNKIEYNVMKNNTEFGFKSQGDSNTIRYNTITGHTTGSAVGMWLTSASKNNVLTNNTFCDNTDDVLDEGTNNAFDSNTCDDLAGGCDWSCSDKIPVYYDYDEDGYYSNTTANCSCSNIAGGTCACCNPGLFSDNGKVQHCAGGMCKYDGPGDDPNDCDNSILGDARPDLVIQDLTVAWLDGGANETHYEVSYKVCNIGGGPSVASVARTTIDSVAQDDQNIGVLAKGVCSGVITVGPFEMDPDSDDIEVCADATNTNPDEIDETNNCSSVTQGARKPDLIITAKYETWEDKPAKTYWINYTVRNIGNATAPESKTRLVIDGGSPSPHKIVALAPGADTGDIRIPNLKMMTGDDDIIRLQADGDNSGLGRIDEWNETNNNRTNTFTYTAIINVSISPCQASIGPYSTNRTSVFIILENIEDYGSGTIDLEFEESVVEVDTITAADCDSDTVTANRVGQGHWRITAVSDDGKDNYVKFANVTFKPKGLPPQCSDLDLTVLTLYDRNFTKLHVSPGTSTKTCKICIFELDPPGVTNPVADPQRILNTNGRARVSGTRLSDLSVYVTDDTSVASITINLTQILLGAGNATVPMVLQSGTNKAGTWHNVTYADRDDDPGTSTPPNPDLPGVNLTHQLYVNATDYHGNSNTGQYIELTVLRRGDVVRDDFIDSADYLYIMMYTVGLVPAPDEFVAGVVPADSSDGVDAGDALYLAMHTVGLVGAP